MTSLHSIRAGVLAVAVSVPAMAAAQEPPLPPIQLPSASSFTIFVRTVPVGSEQIAVTRGADGWTILSTGRMGPPIDLVARRVQVRYTEDWKPVEIVIDATVHGQVFSMQTTVGGTTAQTHLVNNGRSSDRTDAIDADAVLLPSSFFSPFEAVAVRLKTAAPGSTISAYAPPASFAIRVGDSGAEKIQTVARLIEARRTHVVLTPPGRPPLDADVWADETGRLLRLSIPAQNLEVVREDVSSVAARRVTISRPNDEPVRVFANGFSLAGTLSRPRNAAGRLPAVVLVGGSGPTDRDETVFNIPIFGQLAGALADAGYLVLRYDKRGTGQSGGRAEAATLADFADDLRAAVKFMSDRKDVDPKRVAVLGHSEGGSVAMLAAAKDKRIGALVLVATLGVTGAELNLAQVTHALERSKKSDAERQSTIELQKKIQSAVLTGRGWDGIPEALRKQADIPWFQSFLAFDPAKLMPDVRQPILIVQGLLDSQVEPSNADRLEALARARKNARPVDVIKVPGVNHLLVPATTGEFDEYASLSENRVSPVVTTAVSEWLQKTFTPR
jgi:pimeloyl-ACP methyl ester carboxylesterase